MPAGRSSGTNYVFWSDRPNAAQNGQPAWNVSANGWPSLQWMVSSGHRVAVFSDRNYGGKPNRTPGDDGFTWTYQFAVENHYGYKALLDPFSASNRDQSKPLYASDIPLFVLNFFENAIAMIPVVAALLPIYSNYYGLMTKVRGAYAASGAVKRIPNFLAVNFVETPEVLGPMQAIDKINQLLISGDPP